MNTGAAVAAAGFAVSRLIITPPDDALLGRLSDAGGRQSWPVRSPRTLLALETLGEPFKVDAVRADWAQLLGDSPSAIPLREYQWADTAGTRAELTTLEERYAAAGVIRAHVGTCPPDHLARELMYLAHLALRLGPNPDPPGDWAAEIVDFAATHLESFCGPVLDQIDARAQTPPMRALPNLTRGLLEALSELVLAAVPADRDS